MKAAASSVPVFGFLLFGGALSGALIRDIRLANELAQRGYSVHVWWAMDRCKKSDLHPDIRQHWLFNAMRYGRVGPLGEHSRAAKDAAGRLITRIFSDKARNHFLQRRPAMLDWLMHGLILRICDGVQHDTRLINHFARQLQQTGVTHMLPMLSALCPFVEAARQVLAQRTGTAKPFDYIVTFQGYELYANYARALGCEDRLYECLREVVAQSGYPAIAVSEDYAQRIEQDIGLPLADLRAIPPGVPLAEHIDREAAMREFCRTQPRFKPDVPLITYVGRQDVEKGIDLLLYAAAILQSRGVSFQLAICGPTLFGDYYKHVCSQIAENLRCPIFMWRRRVDEKTRAELFSISTCVVYPSIHREPFGMVPVEAMALGTPAIVPDRGGVAQVIEANGACGGLRFKTWDSSDLARQIERLIGDAELWRKLSEQGPRVAEYFSIPRLADRVLAHAGLAPVQRASSELAGAPITAVK